MGTSEAIRYTVSVADAGRTLADVLETLVEPETAALVVQHGGLWFEGRRVADATLRAVPGTQLAVHRPPAGSYAEVTISPTDICYEDDWLLALNKHVGWYTGATPWDIHGNALAALARFLEARDGRPYPLHLAHQLDRDTSGVLLFSKDPRANGPLQAAFAHSLVDKSYLGICAGEPAEDVFDAHTGHGRAAGGRWRVYPLEQVGMLLPGGGRVKAAYTQFRTEQRLGGAARLTAIPATGRTHQIRLHLATLGHPLLGDARYGGPTAFRGQQLPGQLLHAAVLRLAHPADGRRLELRAELPAHMADLCS